MESRWEEAVFYHCAERGFYEAHSGFETANRWGRRRSFIRINPLPDAPLPASAGTGTVGPCCRDLRRFGLQEPKDGRRGLRGGPMPRVLSALRPHFFSQLPGAEKHLARSLLLLRQGCGRLPSQFHLAHV
jgi:hypothetical protein